MSRLSLSFTGVGADTKRHLLGIARQLHADDVDITRLALCLPSRNSLRSVKDIGGLILLRHMYRLLLMATASR